MRGSDESNKRQSGLFVVLLGLLPFHNPGVRGSWWAQADSNR